MARLSELGVDFEHWCFACGRLNDSGLHLDFDVSRGRAETICVTERRRELERSDYSRTDETFARVRAAVAAEETMEHRRT